MGITWNDAYIQAVHDKIKANLALAGAKAVLAVVNKISTVGPPRSSPGEPPHVDTGELISGIFYNVSDDLQLTVGFTADYGWDLEYGTSKMAARPFLRNTLDEMMPEILETSMEGLS